MLVDTASVASVDNPFPGPKPYGRDDAYFFGRDEEIDELTSLVLSSNAVIMDAPSGTGKSSLINAGLLPNLTAEGFRVIQVQVAKMTIDAGRPSGNVLAESVRASIVAQTGVEGADLATVLENLAGRDTGRHVVVLDQFEQIFFRYPQHWADRLPLFRELGDGLRRNTNLRLLIAIRTDWVASLAPYQRQLPGDLVVRYSLGSLGEEAARDVMKRVFQEGGQPLDDAVVDALVTALVEVPLGQGEATFRGESVNLILLQIVCRRLWTDLSGNPGALSSTDAAQMRAIDVDTTMDEFVDEAVAGVVQRTAADESRVRNWLELTLITPANRRDIVRIDEAADGSRHDEVIKALEDARLVTSEQRNRERWVELTHDTMVFAVRRSNAKWRAGRVERQRRLQLALAVVLVLLAAAFVPLRDSPPSTVRVLDSSNGTIGSKSAAVRFRLASNEAAVVSATLSAPSPGATLTVWATVDGVTKETSKPLVPPIRFKPVGVGDTGASVDTFRPAEDSVAASEVLRPSRITSYRAEIVADAGTYRIDVTSVVLIKPGATDEVRRTVNDYKFAVAVEKGRPVVVTVDTQIAEISGARVLLLAARSAVIRAEEAGYALFSLDYSFSGSTVTVRNAPEPTLDGSALDERASAAVLDVPEVVPRAMALELICGDPIGVVVLDAEFRPVTPRLSTAGLYGPFADHVYVLANLPSGGEPKIVVLDQWNRSLTCDVRTASLADLGTVGEASGFFERDVRVAADQGATGFLLRTASDSIVIIDVPLALRPGLACGNDDPEYEIGGKRLTMLVAGDRTCVLLLLRSDLSRDNSNYTSSPGATIRIAPLPGIGTERPRA